MAEGSNIRKIAVTARNLWFLERSIPLFDLMDFFPQESVGPPEAVRPSSPFKEVKKLTLETDQGWNLVTDITADQKVFRNRSRNRGTGRWVQQAQLKVGDFIVIEKLEQYRYRLGKESRA